LSEEEIRADKNLRRELSEAQKAGCQMKTDSHLFRILRGIVKYACKDSQLSLDDPRLLQFISVELEKRKAGFFGFRYGSSEFESASTVLVKYKKLLKERNGG
jgi:hypothetical protein